MEMKPGGLTTMWLFSVSPRVVPADAPNAGASLVTWYEQHGDSGTYQLERWQQKAPNIFVATSLKK